MQASRLPSWPDRQPAVGGQPGHRDDRGDVEQDGATQLAQMRVEHGVDDARGGEQGQQGQQTTVPPRPAKAPM